MSTARIIEKRWARPARIAMIEAVRERPNMWMLAKRKAADPKLWEEVAQVVREKTGEEHGGIECKAQFRNLCDNFRRNKKKCYDLGREPSWEYWKIMTFMLQKPNSETPLDCLRNRAIRCETELTSKSEVSCEVGLSDSSENLNDLGLTQMVFDSINAAGDCGSQRESFLESPAPVDCASPFVTVAVSDGSEISLPVCVDKDEGLLNADDNEPIPILEAMVNRQLENEEESISPPSTLIRSLCTQLGECLESLHSQRPEVAALYEYEISYTIARIQKSIDLVTQLRLLEA